MKAIAERIDRHTLLTIAIIAALVALTIAGVAIPDWLYVLAAAVSPGLVLKAPEPKP